MDGVLNAYTGIRFMWFQTWSSLYLMRGVSDSFPGVCYRSVLKEWMDRRVFVKWLLKRRVRTPLRSNKECLLFNNATVNALTQKVKESLTRSNTDLRYLLKDTTDLCQAADSFLIEMKGTGRRLWDEKRRSMIEQHAWVDYEKESPESYLILKTPSLLSSLLMWMVRSALLGIKVLCT